MEHIVVRNTFLHVSKDSCTSLGRRCSSVPRHWKPNEFLTLPPSHSFASDSVHSPRSIYSSDDFLSVSESCSDADSEELLVDYSCHAISSCRTPTGSCSCSLKQALQYLKHYDREIGADASADFQMCLFARTPTGSRSCACSGQLNYFRHIELPRTSRSAPCTESTISDVSLGADSQASIELEEDTVVISACKPEGTVCQQVETTFCKSQVPQNTDGSNICCSCPNVVEERTVATNPLHLDIANNIAIRTKLTGAARSFQPLCPSDTRMNAILSAAHLVLVSCIPANRLKIERGLNGNPTTSIVVDLTGEPAITSSANDALHLVKKAMDDVIDRLGGATLLNARICTPRTFFVRRTFKDYKHCVCKRSTGCSLHSTVACWPEGHEENMCWDLLTTGSCPRRKRCRWHHPQPLSKMKINVLISEGRNAQDSGVHASRSCSEKPKLDLNTLVH